ncbi:hypothetical protein J5226_03985 [Lysobacter sp. K5869]|uniref:hypothetical protein n=1 Tax=Lysobacter sp. K5869 TaxID=2820808 RepID=UPI001C061215|nr:hypothetical protein [Lysobacter sp. K5869]QWP77578.1 hypothetical protein J5226_03985 [Lysobacter sp. K5869]
MIARLARYVAGSYPPAMSVSIALLWAYGVSGLFALCDPRGAAWRPDAATALAALTLAVDLLLMRMIDDLRDLDYDRIHEPQRPLARGAVRAADLGWAYALLSLGLVALNWGHAGLPILIAQLLYALLVLFVYRRWRWPDGDKLVLSLLISCPGQLLLHLYLYAGYLASAGHGPDGYGLLALAVVFCASLHPELAKKIVREPAPGQRSYVRTFGLRGTVAAAMGFAALSTALLLAPLASRWAAPGLLLLAAPLALPLAALIRFGRPEPRWRAKYALWYLLASFASYAIGGALLASRHGQWP